MGREEVDENDGRGYKRLEVYQRSFRLLRPIHDLAKTLPDYERFDLANQMRRAAKSIPANIAEGYGLRDAPKLFCKHLRIALGSTNEMGVHLDIAADLEYILPPTKTPLFDEYDAIGKMLYRLLVYWRKRLPPEIRELDD